MYVRESKQSTISFSFFLCEQSSRPYMFVILLFNDYCESRNVMIVDSKGMSHISVEDGSRTTVTIAIWKAVCISFHVQE